MTATSSSWRNVKHTLISGEVSIAPLVTFRIIFGLIMLISLVRFAAKGWIYEFYIQPEYHFTFLGFDWIKPLPDAGMYFVFATMGVAALFIAAGFLYRYASVSFFVLFTWVELIDKTFYLNHYYFISIISFLLIWVPSNRYLSVDCYLNPKLIMRNVPAWTVNIFKLQLGLVYFYAGVAKVNPDWLFEALPLKIWLPARAHFPVIGVLFNKIWVAYFFSWAGMMYDLLIPFLLITKKTRGFAYVAAIFFHVMTRILFPIGMFPFIMIGLTLIFFSESFHDKFIRPLEKWFKPSAKSSLEVTNSFNAPKWIFIVLIIHFAIQFTFPFRYLLYPGNLFWTEQGYRFSWRVMLMEKAGMCDFFIRENETGETKMIDNSRHLSISQERMMATQPDMILQYAHFLKKKYQVDEVYAQSLVTLQGSRSKPIVGQSVNLAKIERNWKHKNWILPFDNAQ